MRYYVLFDNSFRGKSAPNISHETTDKQRTLCGRKVSDAATFEPDNNDLDPDCATCRRALARLRRSPPDRADASEEAQLRCGACASGHAPGELRRPCGVLGCECWCNR